MARPRKGAPRPDTVLVAFRLSRELLASLDSHARRTSGTRSDALRELVTRGLGSFEAEDSARSMPNATNSAPKPRRKGRPQSAAETCTWCLALRGQQHHAACPHNQGSGLRALFLGRLKGP